MNNATLMYVINDNNSIKNLKLESQSLYYIDNYTKRYKNEEDFINNYYNKNKIFDFIKENGDIKGQLVISYARNVSTKENIQPLFNTKENFIFNEDPYEGRITEIEKARKLLFNSKNQLFVKLILKNNTLDRQLNKLIDLTDEEYYYINSFNIKTTFINNKHYISFKSLFEYRIKANKLGYIRSVYQEMLDILKSRLMILDDNNFYFYNRQLRIVINKYNELISQITIKNLRIKKMKKNVKYVIQRIA